MITLTIIIGIIIIVIIVNISINVILKVILCFPYTHQRALDCGKTQAVVVHYEFSPVQAMSSQQLVFFCH